MKYHLTPSLLLIPFALLSLTACGNNKKKASKENFAAAIQADLKANPSSLKVCGQLISPIGEREADYYTSVREKTFFKNFKVLQEKGYMTITDKPADAQNSEAYVRVAVTDKFIKDFGEPYKQSGFFTTSLGKIPVCYGTAKFKEVTDFTEPSETMGMKVSQAEYTLTRTLDTDKPWAKDKVLLDALDFNVNLVDENREATMVLKDSGWVVGD